ncbi:glucose-6-phosphate isomerase [Neisseria meningitidis]|uniref:Glucose-6-phosphate isomerase n=1 Tax=Neisseria meningitidis TaxID=487 RepID=X5FBQ9_NEIME|nr:glucose-6-phosphate isomerase [Neisseria meningitidis]
MRHKGTAARPIPKRQCSATARVLLTNMRLRGTIAHSFQMNILPENTGKRPTKHLT